MTRVRAVFSRNSDLYIDKHAFYCAYHFALQYPEWKRQYAELLSGALRAVDYNDSPHVTGTGDPTSRIAMRSSIFKSNIELVERTALIAGRDLSEYLLYAVTNEGVTYNYLRGEKSKLGKIPCSRNHYYRIRRLFYYLLSKDLEKANVKN